VVEGGSRACGPYDIERRHHGYWGSFHTFGKHSGPGCHRSLSWAPKYTYTTYDMNLSHRTLVHGRRSNHAHKFLDRGSWDRSPFHCRKIALPHACGTHQSALRYIFGKFGDGGGDESSTLITTR